MTTATGTDDRIILRQSWLGSLAMCPERARQDMLGISQSTESSNTAIGTAVHYGIEQCLITKMETGDPLPKSETICASIEEWVRKEPEIVRWNHKVELPLVVDHKPEIWLQGTIDCVQSFPRPIVDWKNPGRKPSDDWEKKRWSVQAAAYTWAVSAMSDNILTEPLDFEFVYLVKGKVYRTTVNAGPAEWASLVALARSAGSLISANLPVWPLNMTGWHCAPKWCGAWATCRGRFAGPDPWNQL